MLGGRENENAAERTSVIRICFMKEMILGKNPWMITPGRK
jgi:hypothetical protein